MAVVEKLGWNGRQTTAADAEGRQTSQGQPRPLPRAHAALSAVNACREESAAAVVSGRAPSV